MWNAAASATRALALSSYCPRALRRVCRAALSSLFSSRPTATAACLLPLPPLLSLSAMSLLSRLVSSRPVCVSRQAFASVFRFYTISRDPNAEVQRGHVKWFDSKKGYGFIDPSNGGESVFVHQSAIYAQGFRSLAEGEEVEFEVQTANGKVAAKHVSGPGGNFVRGAPKPPPQQREGGRRDSRGWDQ